PKVIALASKSTRLLVSLHNENCDFTITDDLTTLLFDSAGKDVVSSIHLLLSNNSGEEIQSHEIPCHTSGRVSSVRMDAVYPLVFG
ncbi:hypothetical protein PENTCL1PPCAC_9019, partial [Pristionchus entomophagus]